MLSVLTGFFQSFLICSVILLVHECGHFFTAYFLGWKVDKIKFYPYGGCSIFKEDINRPIKEEFFILLMGPLIQIGLYLFLSSLPLLDTTKEMIKTYHYSILIFNLLPIYPLDGGKLCYLLFCRLFPYKKSFRYTIFASSIFLFLLALFLLKETFSLNVCLLCLLLLTKLIEENKKKEYYYQRFLLERYLKKYPYHKTKTIERLDQMQRDYRHVLKRGGHYKTERQLLKEKFGKK